MLALAAAAGALALVPATGFAANTPPVGHVWMIVLENENASTTFGPPSPAPYLARTLPAMGQYLPNYFAIGHQSNDNYIAMISGQGPNPVSQADCQLFANLTPGTAGPNGQAIGQGCVYPSSVSTLANQLTAAGLTWRAYEEDMGNTPSREAAACGHPAIGAPDGTQKATPSDQYAARHDPFVYFHSIIDSPICQQDVGPLTRLNGDLQSVTGTPSFSFITPNLCHDGHDSPCADGEPGGLTGANQFLGRIVPEITGSPAFRQNGLLVVTFDESESGSQSCCGEDQDALAVNGSNTPNPGATTPGSGGGQIGAVLVSPFIKGGTVNQRAYNHYSLLASIEDLFGLPHLGFAGVAGLPTFGGDVFNATHTTGAPPPVQPAPIPGCVARALPRGAHDTLRRGSLIAAARLQRRRRGRTLVLSFAHAARLDLSVRRDGRRLARARARAVRACRTDRIVLPGSATRGATVQIEASVRGARERRRLRVSR